MVQSASFNTLSNLPLQSESPHACRPILRSSWAELLPKAKARRIAANAGQAVRLVTAMSFPQFNSSIRDYPELIGQRRSVKSLKSKQVEEVNGQFNKGTGYDLNIMYLWSNII